MASPILKFFALFKADNKSFTRAIKQNIKNVNNLTKTTAKNQSATSGLAKEAVKASGSMLAMGAVVSKLGGFLGGLATTAIAASAAIGKLAEQGGRFLTVGDAFARTAAQGSGAINSLRASTRGLIDDFKLMTLFNRAVTLGAVDTTAQFKKMAEGAIVLGRSMNEGATFALESLTLGIGRQSRLFLDNLGLIIKVEQAYRRYAATLGLTTAQLTEEQRKTAFRVEAFRLIADETDRLGGIVLNAGDAFTQFTVAVTNAVNETKKLLAESEGLKEFFEFWTEGLRSFFTGVSPTGQATLTRIGLMGEGDIDELKRIQSTLRNIFEDPKLLAAAQAQPAAFEEGWNRLQRLFPILVRNTKSFWAAIVAANEGQLVEGVEIMDTLGPAFEAEFGKQISGPDSLEALGLGLEEIENLMDAGIFTAMELFNQLGRFSQLKGVLDNAGILFGEEGDLPAILDEVTNQLDILAEKGPAAAAPKEINTAILSWRELATAQKKSADELRRLTIAQALATTTKEAGDLAAQISNVEAQFRALNAEISKRGGELPAVIDFWESITVTATDNMQTAIRRFTDDLLVQFGKIPSGWKKVLDQMEKDVASTRFLENVTDVMEQIGREMAQLERENAGAEAFRSMGDEVRVLLLSTERLLGKQKEGTREYKKTVEEVEKLRDLLEDLDKLGLSFFERLQLQLEDFSIGDALEGALGNLISGGITTALGVVKDAFIGLFSSAESALEKNTRAVAANTEAILQSLRGIAGGKLAGVSGAISGALSAPPAELVGRSIFRVSLVERLRRSLEAAGLSMDDFNNILSTLGLEFDGTAASLAHINQVLQANAFDSFAGKMDLARASIAAMDIEGAAEQFDVLRDALAESLGGTDLGRIIAGLSLDEIGLFFQDLIEQIRAGTFDFGQLPDDISIDEFIAIIGELENLGDAAQNAADQLNEVARNVPTGFKVARARFNATIPSGNPFADIDTGGPGSRPPVRPGTDDKRRGGDTFNVENMTIVTDDPELTAESLGAEARRQARRGGVTDLQLATK